MKGKANKATTNAAGKTAIVTNGRIAPNAKIKILVKGNPKQGTSAAYKLFALYQNGMTAAQYVARVKAGSVRRNAGWVALKWDLDRKYIALS